MRFHSIASGKHTSFLEKAKSMPSPRKDATMLRDRLLEWNGVHQAAVSTRPGCAYGETITGYLLLWLALYLAEDSGDREDLWQYDGRLPVTVRRRAGVEQIERHAGSAVHLEDFCNFCILSSPIGP
jgi:hypothetical protein